MTVSLMTTHGSGMHDLPVKSDYFFCQPKIWCGRRDLNPHDLRHQNLNLTCLPISPRPHIFVFSNKNIYRQVEKLFFRRIPRIILERIIGTDPASPVGWSRAENAQSASGYVLDQQVIVEY